MTQQTYSRSILIVASLLLTLTSGLNAQETTKKRIQESCSSCTGADIGLCHFSIAVYLLKGVDGPRPECFAGQDVTFPAPKSKDGIGLAIAELELAKQSESSLSKATLDNYRAGAFLELGQQCLHKADTNGAAEAFASAHRIYQDMMHSVSLPDHIATLAVGFLRAGDPLSTIVAAEMLGQNNPMKNYLKAEALFSLGDREGAASEYTAWIERGCASPLIMMTTDDYGESQWIYLVSKNKGVSLCEQLPTELRTRLDALRQQSTYLQNLPKSNNAPQLYQPRSDH